MSKSSKGNSEPHGKVKQKSGLNRAILDAYFGHRDRAFRRIVTDAHVVVLRG